MFDLVVSASSIFGGMWEAGAGAIAAENQTLAVARRAGPLPRRRRRVLRLRRLGGQPVGAGHGTSPSPAPPRRRPARRTVVLRGHRRDARLGARRGPGDGRRRARRAAGRARPDDGRRRCGRRSPGTAPTGCSPSSATSARPTSAPSTSSTPWPTCAPSSISGCTSTPRTAAPRCAHRRPSRCAPASSAPTASASTRTSGCSPPTTVPPSCTAIPPSRPTPTPSTAPTSTWSAATSGTRATSPSTSRGGHAGCRCGSAWRRTAPTPTPRRSRRHSRSPRRFAAEVDGRDGFQLLLDPQLSVVLFTVDGWDEERYTAWSESRAKAGVALIVPTWWQDAVCYRVCIINPLTTPRDALVAPRRHGVVRSHRDVAVRRPGARGPRRRA